MNTTIFHKSHGAHAGSFFGALTNSAKKSWKGIVFYTLLTLLYFSRALFLESDLPPWGVITYQPIDEGTYANLALNLINFGSIDPNAYYQGQYEFLMQSHVICNLIGNFFVGISLMVFGDNYFGLRMGVVVIGYLILILFCLTISELRKAYGAKEKSPLTMAFLVILALVASFVFFNATKAVEPSIFRLLFVQLIVFCLVKTKMSIKVRGFLVGLFVFVSIFLVYVTNLFVGIPVIAYAIFVFATQGKRSGFLFVLFGLIGALLALLLATIYFWCCWGTTPIANAINSVLIFEGSEQSGNAYAVGIENFVKNARAFFASNTMLYMLPLMGIVLVCFPLLVKQALKATGGPVLALLMTVLGFFAQTVVSDDFVVRKAVVILPSLLLLFYCCCLCTMRQNEQGQTCVGKIVAAVFFILTTALMFYVTYYRLFRANSATITKLDYSDFDIVLLITSCAFSVLIAGIFLVGLLADRRKITSVSFYASVLICIAINLCFVFNYNILNQTYTEKEIMIDLGKAANGRVVAGEYENGFTLYNDILPLFNDQKTLTTYLDENPDLLYFDYSNAQSSSRDPQSIYQHIEETIRFERAYEAFGKSPDMSLYEPNRLT